MQRKMEWTRMSMSWHIRENGRRGVDPGRKDQDEAARMTLSRRRIMIRKGIECSSAASQESPTEQKIKGTTGPEKFPLIFCFFCCLWLAALKSIVLYLSLIAVFRISFVLCCLSFVSVSFPVQLLDSIVFGVLPVLPSLQHIVFLVVLSPRIFVRAYLSPLHAHFYHHYHHQGLLNRNPAERLGSSQADAKEVMSHPFFAEIDWDGMLLKRYPPPFKPSVGKVGLACWLAGWIVVESYSFTDRGTG